MTQTISSAVVFQVVRSVCFEAGQRRSNDQGGFIAAKGASWDAMSWRCRWFGVAKKLLKELYMRCRQTTNGRDG